MVEKEKEKKKEEPEEEKNYGLVTMGKGEVWARKDSAGFIVSCRANVKLHQELDEIANVLGKDMICAKGYTKLNQIANVSLMTPLTVVVDGQEKSNPYIERDPQSKAITLVIVRKIGMGYSPIGNMVVLDKSVEFNLYTYFLQALQAKVKKYKNPGKLCTKNQVPEIEKEMQKEGKGVWFPIQPPVGLWIDLTHEEIISAFDDQVQRQKFASRIAQTICERNILQNHPAIAVSRIKTEGPDKKKVGIVTIYGYRHPKDAKEIESIGRKIAQGKTIDGIDILKEEKPIQAKPDEIQDAESNEFE